MRIVGFLLLALFSVGGYAQPLDKANPIRLKGDRIVYQGKTITLDSRHLYLDGNLKETTLCPYAYKDFKTLASHFVDSCTVYIAPNVYWIDDPTTPEVAVGKDGREPFGMVIHAKKLHFIGLNPDSKTVVLASQRGQTQGAIGNFTMFDIWCDSLTVENLTMGNYCNVDLDYPLDARLNRNKRSDAITQAHVGYVHGEQLVAKRVRFISRLNLNPLNGARHSYYEDCHFECTDDALNGTATYRHCDFDLYGQKPFWSTFGKGALFVDCDFYVKGSNREMYFCKQGGPVTLVDCRYHAPSDSIYLGWTAYPQPWLRCYQQNFTLNGKPYLIGHRQPRNTVLLSDFVGSEPPYLFINTHQATLLTGQDTLFLVSHDAQWRIENGFEDYVSLSPYHGDTVRVIPTNNSDETVDFCVEAYADDGRLSACQLSVKPSVLLPPSFAAAPTITGSNPLHLDYVLCLDGHRDESRITWYRDAIPVSTSNDSPQRTYHLTAADVGHLITAEMEPKSNRSEYGEAVKVSFQPEITPSRQSSLETDFHDFPCDWQPQILPGYWTVDGYKPQDTSEFPWSFDPSKPMWEYKEGFNGAVGMGLLQAQRGARLMYTPLEKQYGDMHLTLQVDPTKTAGQGFGSATGQYMDVCLKFDTQTLTGYGLRIIRTTKYAKAVDFYLVRYDHGSVQAISEAVSSTCYRTGCAISLDYIGSRLIAHVNTSAPRPTDSVLPHEVSLAADVTANTYGGICIQHTGSSGGESTTMLHNLSVRWE